MNFGSFDDDYFNLGKPKSAAKPQPKKKQGRGGFATSLISEGGALGGAATGAALGSVVPGIGTIIGAGIGGALGGFGGRVAENKVRDDRLGIGDAAKEGALSGVFGAGPIRLAQVGKGVVGGVKGGNSLVDAVQTATSAAKSSTIRGAIGGKVDKATDDLTVKAFGLNPTQLKNFQKLHGEDAGKFIKRFGFQTPDDVTTKGIQPLQAQFDEAVEQIPDISKAALKRGLEKVYKPLLKDVNLTRQGLGQGLKTQFDEIMKMPGDSISAPQLNELRKSFDEAVRYTQKGAPDFNVNKETADALRGILQRTADKAGVGANGRTFKEIGKELSKLYDIEDVVALTAQKGRGSLPVGMTTLLGGTAGASMGPLGAAGTALGVTAMNSKLGRRAVMGGAERASGRLLAGGQKAADNAFGVKGLTKRIGAAGALEAGLSGGMPQTLGLEDSLMQNQGLDEEEPYIPSFMQEEQQMGGSEDSSQLITKEQALTAMLNDIQTTGGKNIEKIKALYEFANPESETGLNSTAAGVVTDLQNGIINIRELSDQFANSGVNSPLLGGLRGKMPYDTEAQSLQANIARVKQVIGKALEGGVLRKEDELKYAKILPTLRDTDAVAKNKIKFIADDLDRKLYLYQQNLGGSGGGATLEDALMQRESY